MKEYSNVVIFGGSGYIAGYIVNYLISQGGANKIYLADIKEPRKEMWEPEVESLYKENKIEYYYSDVRETISLDINSVDIIFNLAAIHREPGHKPKEYFDTNIKGAENVIQFAESVNCTNIIFTSSIAPYGHAHCPLNEKSSVVPYSPYGSSKLTAEKIHEGWKSKDSNRKLVIVRPGVIYGPHEDGNVPRLKQALKKNAFCYVGNKEVQKAGGYVKELVRSMLWVFEYLETHEQNYVLYNFSFEIPPTLEEYVNAITDVLEIKRFVPNIPYQIILGLSYVVSSLSKLCNVAQPIHPSRIKKLKVNNLIIPKFLIDSGYDYTYDLQSSLIDWKKDAPGEWS